MSEEAFPNSEEEFQQLMEDIDRELRNEDAPIPVRPMRAHTKLIERFPVSRVLTRPSHDPPAGSYEGWDLVERAYRWYDDRYEDRLQVDFTVGRIVVIIRGDPWTIEIPLMYGEQRLVAEPGVESDPDGVYTSTDEPPLYNVLDSLTDMPDGFKDTLSAAERNGVVRTFVLGHKAFFELRTHQGKGLVREAWSDLGITVEHLTAHPRREARAQWAALQASEKILKAFIRAHSGSHPRSHDIQRLTEDAYGHDLQPVPQDAIDTIDLYGRDRADVRYGEADVSLEEAVRAHQESVNLCLHVAHQLP